MSAEPFPRDATPGESLGTIGIFRELPPDELASLARRCTWRRYRAGQAILHYRDNRHAVFFVVHGRACVLYHSASGREVRFGDFTAGNMFGEFAAIDGAPHMADVICVTDALVAAMSADLFREVLRRHESVCAAVLRRLTGIARNMSRRVIEFSTLPVRHRLHAELLRLAQLDTSDPRRGMAVIAPAPTHAEIASRISTHREAVSREIADLTRHGLIERRGGDLVIRDVGALASMVAEELDEPAEDVDLGTRIDPRWVNGARGGLAARFSDARARPC
jgi:CRP/FNR family cyclic AMP-dependent transcriptional regulator